MPASVSTFSFDLVVGIYRLCVVDFQMKRVLGELAITLRAPNKRRFTFSFQIIVQRYLGKAEAQFTLHEIPFKMHQPKEQCHTLDPLSIEVCLRRRDEIATCLLMNAENLQKFRTEEVDYSSET